MEGVEDIPGVALHEGLKWNWESFGEYLDALEQVPHDIDVCAQLAAWRAARLCDGRARRQPSKPANEDDIAKMRHLTTEAMRAGAIGFSTSRTILHKSVKGDPTPGLRAEEAELMGIAMGIADAGRGVIEMISDFNTPDPLTEFAMIRRLVERSGRPLSLSLAQAGFVVGWLARIARPDRAGVERWPADPRPGRAASHRLAARPSGHDQSVHRARDVRGDQGQAARRQGAHHARSVVPRAHAGGDRGEAIASAGAPRDGVRPHLPARRSAELRAAEGNLARRTGRARQPRARRTSPTTCCWKTRAARSCSRRSPTTPTSISIACGEMIAHPDTRDGPRRRRRACRHHLRRELRDLSAHPLGPRPRQGQVRSRLSGEAPDRRHRARRRPYGSRRDRAGQEGRPQRHRLRQARRCRRRRWPSIFRPAASACCRARTATTPRSSRAR